MARWTASNAMLHCSADHQRCPSWPDRLRRWVVALFWLPLGAQALELSGAARKEVDHLLVIVGRSGCEFYRAGTWHSAVKAQVHLGHKFEYLATRQMLGSAEDFIAKAATRSSMTGEAYAIRCPHQPARPSADWLEEELRALRAQRLTASPSGR